MIQQIPPNIVTMLDIASRSSTSDGEAINAIRLVKSKLKELNIELIDIITLKPQNKQQKNLIEIWLSHF